MYSKSNIEHAIAVYACTKCNGGVHIQEYVKELCVLWYTYKISYWAAINLWGLLFCVYSTVLGWLLGFMIVHVCCPATNFWGGFLCTCSQGKSVAVNRGLDVN